MIPELLVLVGLVAAYLTVGVVIAALAPRLGVRFAGEPLDRDELAAVIGAWPLACLAWLGSRVCRALARMVTP